MARMPLHARRALPLLLAVAYIGCGGDDGGMIPVAPEAASIEIELATLELEYGAATTAEAIVYDANGAELEDAGVAWTSSNESVLQVSDAGVVTATGSGVAELRASLGDVTEAVEVRVVPRTLYLASPDASVTQYEVVKIVVPEQVTMPTEPIAATIGDDTLHFAPATADTLVAVVTGVQPISGDLWIEFDANHVGYLALTVAAAPVVLNPEAEFGALELHVDELLADLQVVEDSTGVVAGLDAARTLRAAFAAWQDTASVESRQAVAQFLVANPALMQPMSAAAARSAGIDAASAAALCSTLSSGTTREQKLDDCADAVVVSLAVASVGMNGVATCAAGPPAIAFCLAAITVAGTGWAYAIESVERVLELAGIIIDEDLELAAGAAPAPRRTSAFELVAGELLFTSGQPYALQASATYRSPISSDGAGALGALSAGIAKLAAGWQNLEAGYDLLASLVLDAAPPLPAPPAGAPATPASVADDAVAHEYLTISAGGDVGVTFDAQTGQLIASLTSGLEQDFDLSVQYASPFGSFVDVTTATVRVDGRIEKVSGDGQTATPGSALDEPLVVRIVDQHSDAPVSGVAIAWTVIDGGGSIAGGATTDASGVASATWTLGTDDGAQLVEAAATYADGSDLSGGPVSFSAGADTTAAIALVSGGGQIGSPGNQLPSDIVVQVTSTIDGSPIAGAAVSWSVQFGGGSIAGMSTTDANGYADGTWTMGESEGAQILEVSATVDGTLPVSGSPITVNATSSLQMQLVMVLGDGQTAEPNTQLADPLIVRVIDHLMNPVAGKTVRWAIVEGGGSLSGTTTTTDANGEAQVFWTIGEAEAGTVEASLTVDGAHVDGSPVLFRAGAIQLVRNTIATGEEHTCALTPNGAAYCWGGNIEGQLGTGDYEPRLQPTAVAGGHVFTEITAGSGHTCALDESGATWCWGWGAMLGAGTDATSTTPVAVAGAHEWVTVASSTTHTCAIDIQGAAWCWGWNTYGQLGSGTASGPDQCWSSDGMYSDPCALTPVRVPGTQVYQSISTGQEHGCAIDADGGAWCWGNNGYGQLGNGSTGSLSTPVAVGGGHVFTTIGVGDFHSCAVDGTGVSWCWGSNSYGVLGVAEADGPGSCSDEYGGSFACSVLPMTFADADKPAFVRIDGAEQHTCAVGSSGAVWCWGSGDSGQAGNGSRSTWQSPAPAAGATSFTQVSGAEVHSCAIDIDGRAWCWGLDQGGNLGFTPLDDCGDGTFSAPCALVPGLVGGGVTFQPAPRQSTSRTMRARRW